MKSRIKIARSNGTKYENAKELKHYVIGSDLMLFSRATFSCLALQQTEGDK